MLVSLEELNKYSRYDAILDSAVVKIDPSPARDLLFTVGSRDRCTLDKRVSDKLGYTCEPVRAYYVSFRGGHPFLRECTLVAPSGLNTFLIWDGYSYELEEVSARLFTIDNDEVIKWRIPAYTLPYCYYFDAVDIKTDTPVEEMSDFIGSFDSYDFGQKFGKLYAREYSYQSFRLSPEMSPTVGFRLNELPTGCNILSFSKLNVLMMKLQNSKFEIMSKEIVNEKLSILLECFGDRIYEICSTALISEEAKYKIISLEVDTKKTPYLVIAALKSTDKGFEVKLLKRDFVAELRKGDNCKLSDIVFFKDIVRVNYADKTVDYDRAVLTEQFGCGVTKKTEQQALAAKLTGGSEDLILWGDGTLKQIRPNKNGAIVMPSTVRELASGCIRIDDDLQVKKIVFNSGIEKVSPELIDVGGTAYAHSLIKHCELEYLGENLDVYTAILQAYALSTGFTESGRDALNVKLYDGLDGRNIFVISAYISAISNYTAYASGVPASVITNGLGRYLSSVGTRQVLDTTLERVSVQAQGLKKARYSTPAKCANTANWSNVGNFSLSTSDFRFQQLIFRLSCAFAEHLRHLLSEEEEQCYFNKISEWWDFIAHRAELLMEYCYECYKKVNSRVVPEYLMTCRPQRHTYFRKKG